MMSEKHSDIIPIVYMGGTGGNFLGYLLTAAKYKMNDGIDFSKHGNAHYSYKDIPQPSMANTYYGAKDNDIFDFIDKIKPYDSNSKAPYFCPCHVKDINRVAETFEKSIQITFTNDDIDELVLVYMGKWYVDDKKQAPTHNKISVSFALDFHMHLKKNQAMGYPNVLNVSWIELYKDDVNILIQKLSEFTEIPKENFPIEILNEWRTRTSNGVEELREQLNLLNKI